jgi:hypothetical protein
LLKQYPETEELLLTHVVKFFGVKESIAGQIQNYAMEEFLSEIATRNPEKTWQEIVKYLEPSLNRDERTFALTKWLGGSGIRRKNMLKIFNPSDIWEWIDKDVEHRARYIARLVPTIFKDNVCLARELLIKYGDRKDVRAYLADLCINKGCQFDKPLPEFQKNETNPNVKKWLNEFMGRLKGIEESWKIASERADL